MELIRQEWTGNGEELKCRERMRSSIALRGKSSEKKGSEGSWIRSDWTNTEPE